MHALSILVLGALVAVGISEDVFQLAQQTLPDVFGLGLAAATVGCNHDVSYGGAPQPTQGLNVPFVELVKRQAAPTSVCGLLSVSTQLSYTCPDGGLCGFGRSTTSFFGCCSSYVGSGSLTGCFFPTTCLDYSIATRTSCASSDTRCLYNTQFCVSSEYPYCGKFVESTWTAWDCFKSPSISANLIPLTGAGSGVASTTGYTSSSSFSYSSGSSSRSASTTSAGSSRTATDSNSASLIQYDTSDFGSPQTRTQPASVAITTPTSTSTRNIGVGVEPAGQTWVAYLLSFFLLAL